MIYLLILGNAFSPPEVTLAIDRGQMVKTCIDIRHTFYHYHNLSENHKNKITSYISHGTLFYEKDSVTIERINFAKKELFDS